MKVIINHGPARNLAGLGSFPYGVHEVADNVAKELLSIPRFGAGTVKDLKAWNDRMAAQAERAAEQEAGAAAPEVWVCESCDPPREYKTESGIDKHVAKEHADE